MGLNKQNLNYFYNLGRTVALVQIMNKLDINFVTLVYDNANENLPFQLKEALKKSNHNLINELIEPADIVLNKGTLPKSILQPVNQGSPYWMGYYNEKSYLDETYKGVFGNIETLSEVHVPDRISFNANNSIDELKR